MGVFFFFFYVIFEMALLRKLNKVSTSFQFFFFVKRFQNVSEVDQKVLRNVYPEVSEINNRCVKDFGFLAVVNQTQGTGLFWKSLLHIHPASPV